MKGRVSSLISLVESYVVCGGLLDASTQEQLPGNCRYWEGLDPDSGNAEYPCKGYLYQSIYGTGVQRWFGACSTVTRHVRTKALLLGMLTHYLLASLRLYFGLFSLLLGSLTDHWDDIDPSGSLSSVLSTIVLIVIMLLCAFAWVPCFAINSIHVTDKYALFCAFYYVCVTAATEAFFVIQAMDTTGSVFACQITVTCVDGLLFTFNLLVTLYILYLAKTTSSRSYLVNRLYAFRLYTYFRMREVGRNALSLKRKNIPLETALSIKQRTPTTKLRSDKFDLMRKATWHKRETTVSQLKSVWAPRTELDTIAGYMYEVPDLVFASCFTGFLILVCIAILIVGSADSVFDSVGEKVTSYDSTLSVLDSAPESDQLEKVYNFTQSQRDFWLELQLPLRQSIIAGGYLGITWSASFIPSLVFGAKRVALELQMGLADSPGLLLENREVKMSPYRAMYFFGSYISCVVFGYALSFVCFFLAVLLITWPPFWDLVWDLNWLWLPSCVSIVLGILLTRCFYGRFHYLTKPQKQDSDQNETVGTKTNYTLVRPREWGPIELGNMIAYFPGFAWAAFMRCVYVLLVSMLGVVRIDISFLPTGAHTFDSPYMAFAAMMLRSFQVDSPMTVVAADMLLTTHQNKSRRSKTFYKSRNRFWLALMLRQYPVLRKYRVHSASCGTAESYKNDLLQSTLEPSTY